jgi:hypothetical protein
VLLAPLIYLPIIAFWVFVVYVLWIIAQSLKSIDLSTREIAQALKDRL